MRIDNDPNREIRTAVLEAMDVEQQLATRQIARDITRKIKELRRHYTLANNSPCRTPVDEWLCDNYYVLEKESKQSAKDLRLLSRKARAGELEQAYRVFRQVLFTLQPPICDETVTAILEAMGEVRPVSEQQFSFVPTVIKIILVELAHNACTVSGLDAEISYAIIGLNKLTSVDFEGIIGNCSFVEQILLEDPAGIYGRMNDETRQYYRHLVAQIARKSRRPEQAVAAELLESASLAGEEAERHIGHHILYHRTITGPRRRRGKAAVVMNIILALALAGLAGYWCGDYRVSVLCFLPFWEILRTLVQQLALAGMDVDFIPRMDLNQVERKPKTAVLVSTLLPKASDAPALASRLEQLYFSNSDPDMYYCILADFKEWDYPTDEKDESQVAASRKVIEQLNQRYNNRFLLFLRGRTYNKTQGRYSGWERKRGAITEFIRFVKGEKTSVHTFVGDRSILPEIRYVIALDADTNMLYESAQTLVSAAIHPLNRPVVNADGVVERGYGILTPKISTDLRSAKATAFSRVLSGCGGVTAYDSRDKDFYQDLFGESIFAGKGLIDIECFHDLLENRFPENHVLSHDILEGAYLRVGFVSDVEMTDTAPTSITSWLARLHRWLRGDWQNIIFTARQFRVDGKTYDNPIGNLSKFKLFDNLRRSLTPVTALLCVLAALVAGPRASCILAWTGILAVSFSSVWAAVWSLVNGGFFTMSRKFFTRTLPHTFELMGQALFFLIMMPAQAFITLDAVVRSLWRTFVSRKKMLEWTTAAQSDSQRMTVANVVKRYWLAELFGLFYILLVPSAGLLLLGILFSLVMPLAYYSAIQVPEPGGKLSGMDRDTLISYNAAMWRYYEEFANAENHWLPPDNIQQSPVYRVANRTSPTNIGMMMLSVLAARDFDFIDSNGLYLRLDRTLSTVESLATWNGNLYNWYDTCTLETLKPEFVSTVDSGNFICCLVALKEGLREFAGEKREINDLIYRIEMIIEHCDLHVFYDKRKKLFSIGYEVEKESMVNSYYDFLMSEARLTSYYAVARKIVGKKHWGTLGRTMSRLGFYAGPVSWTGTMFEYFMPHLLLPVYEGSLLGEALSYCLYCQKRRVRGMDRPWGISESAFYAFDNNLNYQYKAHGVQKLGVKRYLDKELVISPYSTFITIGFNPNSAMENLRRLHKLGVYGRYGFFEAVDFTASRVGKGSLAVTRSYMAHHIGMSMVASCNAVFGGRMQQRFMRDSYMRSAGEFLQEKIAKNTVVYDELGQENERDEKHQRPKIKEERAEIRPQNPQCVVLTNGELTDVLTDTGAGYLKFGEIDLTRPGTDLLRRAQGVFSIVRMDGVTLPVTKAPYYDAKAYYSIEHQEESVTYYARKKDLEVGMRCLIHPTISCQQRQIVVKNKSGQKQMAQVLVYLEPVLSRYMDYNAHPAYSKLFVTGRYDENAKTLTFSRRNRDSTVDMYLTVGFLQDIDFVFETRREVLMQSPNGLQDLLRFSRDRFTGNSSGVPDACCALQFDLMVNAGGQQQATLLISAARTEAEGVQNIIAMRKNGVLEPKAAAKSPLLTDSLEARLGGRVLGQLLFCDSDVSANLVEKRENRLGQSALWCMGISGDLPIALVESAQHLDQSILEGYLRLHTSMRSLKIEFDLVILCNSPEEQEELLTVVEQNSMRSILGARGGVFLLQKPELAPELLTLLRAVARHQASSGLHKAESTSELFLPIELRLVYPVSDLEQSALPVYGGSFGKDRFYAEKSSPLPWSHVLSNSQFGTLISTNSLGYTWAINSRENKLTPWYNDIATDNRGELCILHDGDSYFDLCFGAQASFSPSDARYEGKTTQIESRVEVTISQTGCAKYVEVTLKNRTRKAREMQCAYYTEPVLGINRDTARHILVEQCGGTLALHNPYNTAVQSWMALSAEGAERFTAMNNRISFLSGDWADREIRPQNDPCAALIASVVIQPEESVTLRFTLSYGKNKESAAYMATQPLQAGQDYRNEIKIQTPDEKLNPFINTFAPHQILASRLYGRTAFYQCGGAYGFRDQLQDVSAYLLLNPEIARRQIIRCCGVQFEEGDVLHWWHNLPKSGGGIKGVRTRFSDDLLWLPLVTAEYVEKTGDSAVLSIPVRYLRAPELLPHQHEQYISPDRSDQIDSVYSHCVQALEKGMNLAENGLPKIGCGDWNDGFSSIGLKGQGSSVWLALFLVCVLEQFSPICELQGDGERAKRYRVQAQKLREAVDRCSWDGEWYIRAFFDNGEKMGSHQSAECRIDLLPQSFAVLAGMPDHQRVETALRNAREQLVDRDLRLVRLFWPPFCHSHQQPGYVKAYPPGIRENGGQYTHSAVWFAIALIRFGYVDEGWEVLEMLNPVDRASRPELAKQYKLEPYYMAADLYTNEHAAGRGGWSMYTGAVSWYYRAVVEEVLGVKLRGERVVFQPRLPSRWPEASIELDLRGTRLHVSIQRGGDPGVFCDGESVKAVTLDGKEHQVVVQIENLPTGK